MTRLLGALLVLALLLAGAVMRGVMRTITADQANRAYDILVLHAGARNTEWARESFIWHVATSTAPTREFRFQGHLGFGGKFRNNGNHNDTPYVDCYREDETISRVGVMLAVNAMLADLFAQNEGSLPPMPPHD
jgi:hypothetical protein